jgi:hypothetical protein
MQTTTIELFGSVGALAEVRVDVLAFNAGELA